MEKVWGRPKPRVGLLNLGVEESKGTSITKDAFAKLKASNLNFIGNVEAREIPRGVCDIIVCDGFVGNVVLKLTEGVAMNILKIVKNTMMKTLKNKVAALIMKKDLGELKNQFDYEEYGGAPVLGVNGPVIKMHGSSTAVAVKNNIIKGIPYAQENVVEIIKNEMLRVQELIEEEE